MRYPNRTSLFAVLALAAAGMSLAMVFNSCSEVEFSKATGSTIPLCEGAECPTPTTLKNYQDTITIPMGANKADILLVLDNSGSMEEDLAELADKLDGLIDVLDANTVDWRMCYITTDDVDSGSVREWKKASGDTVVSAGFKALLPSTANKRSIFLASINNLSAGESGVGTEEGIVTMRRTFGNSANSECFRADAVHSVVLISDEDEKSCGGRCETWQTNEIGGLNPRNCGPRDNRRPCLPGEEYRDQYRELTDLNSPAKLVSYVDSLWPNRPFVVSPIVIMANDNACYQAQDLDAPAFFGRTYATLQNLTGGILGNICAENYTTQLQNIGKRTTETVNSISLQCPPVRQPTVTLSPRLTGQTWTMTGNKIIFNPPLGEGTVVNVRYTCAVPE